MKNGSIRIGAATLLFVSFLLSLSCGETPRSTNTPQNTNEAETKDVELATNASKTPDIPGESKACGISDFELKRTAVENRIAQNIVNDSELRDMYRGKPNENKDPVFDFRVVVTKHQGTPKFLTVYVAGHINKSGKMDDFANKIKNMMVVNCVHTVVFLPWGTNLDSPAERSSGFRWHYCDYPNQACSDGSCQATCPNDLSLNSNTAANSNSTNTANTNTNSNTYSNSNSNSGNRPD